uniref:DnaD domain-containing protein n=1 Tax=Terrisporobacter sp. TaxID=1965305 RepID=UPI0026028BBE
GVPKTFNYIEGILRNWYDLGLYTREDIENNIIKDKERYDIHRLIFKSLGFSRQPGTEEKRIMDTWLDKYNMDIEVILEACSKSKNTSNPSISYIDKIIQRYKKENVKTLEDVKKADEEFYLKKQQKKNASSTNISAPKVKTRFHNISERYNNYSDEELEKILQESQKGKF